MSTLRSGLGPTGLIPDAMEDSLRLWLLRGAGLALLAASVLGWLALLSWNLNDPAVLRSSGEASGNLLGRNGATLADLVLQSLGMASAMLLFAPTLWGFTLLSGARISRPKAKLVVWPLAALLGAAALSVLPKPVIWPLEHGFGGILGDLLFDLLRTPLDQLSAPLSTLMTFLACIALAALGQMLVLDLELPDGRLSRLAARLAALGPDRDEERIAEPEGWAGDERREPELKMAAPGLHADPPDTPDGPSLENDDDRLWHLDGNQTASGAAPAQPRWQPADTSNGSDEGETDLAPDDDSARMARRFAPPTAVAKPVSASRWRNWLAREPKPEIEPLATVAPAPRPRPPRSDVAPTPAEPRFRLPSTRCLKPGQPCRPGQEHAQSVLKGTARVLEDVLADFGVKGKISNARPGPVITLYELEPARGVKASRVIGLAEDIARSASAASARISVLPGRNVIGIELPNLRREGVALRELIESDAFRRSEAQLPLVLGRSIEGDPVVADLARMPHLLMAGTTGSGKSVALNAMILSLLYRHTPETCRLILIDPKMLELQVYNGIPHLLAPVVTEPRKAVAALDWAVGEMEERNKRMAKINVRNIESYNKAVLNARRQGTSLFRNIQTGFDAVTGEPRYERERLDLEPLPYIVVVIDEMADLMLTAGKEIEASVQRLAQMARAAGIHLVTATQRPSVDVITGVIKANLPARISFKVASKIDSRTVLGEQGAEQLLGAGDMLYCPGAGQATRVHGPFVSDQEIEQVAAELMRQGQPTYIEAITREKPEAGRDRADAHGAAEEDLYERALAIVLRERKVTVSYLQRRLQIGYNRAADLVERMEREGIVGPAGVAGKRQILMSGPNASIAS